MQIDVNFMQIRMASSTRGVGCPSDWGGGGFLFHRLSTLTKSVKTWVPTADEGEPSVR